MEPEAGSPVPEEGYREAFPPDHDQDTRWIKTLRPVLGAVFPETDHPEAPPPSMEAAATTS